MLLSKLKSGFIPVFALAMAVSLAPAEAAYDSHMGDQTYQYESFEDMDADRSGFLSNGEYQSSAFGMADWDDDGYLEESEWTKYTETYYDPYEIGYDSYSYYDTDGDGYIEESEFSDVPTTDLYDAWDYNDDDRISDDEWDQVTSYYYDSE